MLLQPEEIRDRIKRGRTDLTSGWVTILAAPTSAEVRHVQQVRGAFAYTAVSGKIQVGVLASGDTSGTGETALDDEFIDTARNKIGFELGPGEDSEVPYYTLQPGEALRATAPGVLSGSGVTVVWWPERSY